MNEEEKTVQEEKKEAGRPITDPQEQLDKFGSGVFRLVKPIRSRGEDVIDLAYDFQALTGVDYVEAMDSDRKASNAFRLTQTQALNLFARAAAAKTDGIDARDIMEQIGIMDTQKAVQLATVFFVAADRLGNNRISKRS